MQYLLYLVGFIIALAAFLYILNAYESGKERIKTSKKGPGSTGPSTVNPRDIFLKKPRSHPGERLCPLCGSALTRSEALYAAPLKSGDGTKILILGCRYCYKDDGSKDGPAGSL